MIPKLINKKPWVKTNVVENDRGQKTNDEEFVYVRSRSIFNYTFQTAFRKIAFFVGILSNQYLKYEKK